MRTDCGVVCRCPYFRRAHSDPRGVASVAAAALAGSKLFGDEALQEVVHPLRCGCWKSGDEVLPWEELRRERMRWYGWGRVWDCGFRDA